MSDNSKIERDLGSTADIEQAVFEHLNAMTSTCDMEVKSVLLWQFKKACDYALEGTEYSYGNKLGAALSMYTEFLLADEEKQKQVSEILNDGIHSSAGQKIYDDACKESWKELSQNLFPQWD